MIDVDPQWELSRGIILRVQPETGEPWLGVFDFGEHFLGYPRCVIGWPDAVSFCVVDRGSGCLVRADDPYSEQAINCFPIGDVAVAAGHGLVLFTEGTTLIAYTADGIAWESDRLCWDNLRVLGFEGDVVQASGFDPTASGASQARFTVDLATGVSHDAPYVAG